MGGGVLERRRRAWVSGWRRGSRRLGGRVELNRVKKGVKPVGPLVGYRRSMALFFLTVQLTN